MDRKTAKHSIQLPNIVAGCIALGVLVATGFHLAQYIAPIRHDTSTPWIGLPKGGMDASEYSTRAAILQASAMEGWSVDSPVSLASECGGTYQLQSSKFKERYVARIGAGAWGPFRKIVLDVNGDRINVALSDDFSIPPPPSPPGHQQTELTSIASVARIEKSRADLERIRVLWNDEVLWHAPQDSADFGCRDGNLVFLEACIDGRYAARIRNCSADEASRKLWNAFNELLPAPPAPEWRDAKGNTVQP